MKIDGEPEPIRCTANHPFWSEDQQQFVRADHLGIGETLRTESGLTQLQASEPIPGQHTVYNIEVFRNHVYHVGTTGVVVHNGTPCDDYLELAGVIRGKRGNILKLTGADLNHILKRHVDETFDAAENVGRDIPTRFLGSAADYRARLQAAVKQKGVLNQINSLIKGGKSGSQSVDVIVKGQQMRLWVDLDTMLIKSFHAWGQLGRNFTR